MSSAALCVLFGPRFLPESSIPHMPKTPPPPEALRCWWEAEAGADPEPGAAGSCLKA